MESPPDGRWGQVPQTACYWQLGNLAKVELVSKMDASDSVLKILRNRNKIAWTEAL